jgi:hypothetical protein
MGKSVKARVYEAEGAYGPSIVSVPLPLDRAKRMADTLTARNGRTYDVRSQGQIIYTPQA